MPQQPSRRRLAVQAVNLDAWLQEHGPTLKPPVANKLLFGGDLKVMVVGGPNQEGTTTCRRARSSSRSFRVC